MFRLLSLTLLLGCQQDISVIKNPEDDDGDGFTTDIDCDDASAATNPDADERCDGIDNDCDGEIDTNAVDAPSWYADADLDGFGGGDAVVQCDAPEGRIEQDGDCDDGDAAIHPDAAEVCDGIDNNCNDDVDGFDAEGATDWYADTDGDTWGDAGAVRTACDMPDGYVAALGDCDDASAAVSPDGIELCNDVDDDCDGAIDEDEALDASPWYIDLDADGFGDADYSLNSCEQPVGYVADATDCDDTNASATPGATEVCNGLDDDCDGTIDEDDAADATTWYADADADGYGDAASPWSACALPAGASASSDDCDDGAADVYPGADEYCDGIDHDCDGATGEDGSVDALAVYTDADGDGYGDPATEAHHCEQPADTILDGTDCDDTDDAINPAAVEVCDGIDNACLGGPDWNLNVPAVHASIQDAVDAATSGDTVCVAAGTYVENVHVTKPLALVGYEGADVTVIDGGAAGRVVHAEYFVGFELSGFTLTNGYRTGDGAGVFLHHVTGAELSELTVQDSAAEGRGGGVAFQDAEADLLDVSVTGNTAEDANAGGAGIYMAGSFVTARNLRVADNRVTFSGDCYGGGLWVYGDSTFELTNGVIAGNGCETSGSSGGIRGGAGNQDNSEVVLENVTIVGNTSDTNGSSGGVAGWYYTSDSGHPLVVRNTTSTHNTVDAREVAVGAWLVGGLDPDVTFTYSNAWGNDGDTNFWGVDDPTETDGNLSEDPMFTDITASDATLWSLTLASGSPLIDAGDAGILDADSSRSDIGAFGGPGGSW